MTFSFIKAPTAATANHEKDLMQWKMVVAMVGGWLVGWAPYICYILSIMINKNSVDANPYSQKYAYVALPSILARISVVFSPIIELIMDDDIRAQTIVVLTSGKGLE